MSYVIPGILVYQQLATDAGVANVTPDLDACIIGPCFNVVDYIAGSAASLIETAALTSSGVPYILTDSTINNTVFLGSAKPGQIVTPSSVQVFMNAAQVQTKVMLMTGSAGSNVLTFQPYTGVGTATAGSNVLSSVGNASQLNVGDQISVLGAGTASSTLTTTVEAINSSSVTMRDVAATTVTGTTINRTAFNNVNSASSTLRVESGDTAVITYGSTVFNTTVLSLSGTGNIISTVRLADILPAGASGPFTVTIRKLYNNLPVPQTYLGKTNYSAANVGVNSSLVINPLPTVTYGVVVSGSVHVAYAALRTDLANQVLDINNPDDQVAVLGEASDANPLALGVQIALANTVGRIRAIAIQSDDLAGYLDALDTAENSRLYALVPLTQRLDIVTAFKNHVEQMSTPENAAWRIAFVNTAIPDTQFVGQYNPSLVNANSGNNFVQLNQSNYVLNSSNSQFVSDNVTPGDTVKIVSHAPTTQLVSSLTVLSVLNNQQLIVNATLPLTSVNFYVQRSLSKSQQADIVAANSRTLSSSRVLHHQSDLVGVVIDGVTKYLPGYYGACASAGLVSGLPAQQSLTNIGVAGISDLQRSNRYFTRAQMSTISAAGTYLLVQEAAGTIPYVRHSLTTDMTVLQYRELQQVKNIDFLSYFFHDILRGFAGRYNITPDTLQTLRATIIAGAKLLQGKVLPKIGPPLLNYNIKSMARDPVNKDKVKIEMGVAMPTVMNYVNLYLIY